MINLRNEKDDKDNQSQFRAVSHKLIESVEVQLSPHYPSVVVSAPFYLVRKVLPSQLVVPILKGVH